jgi:hypothetical protein
LAQFVEQPFNSFDLATIAQRVNRPIAMRMRTLTVDADLADKLAPVMSRSSMVA